MIFQKTPEEIFILDISISSTIKLSNILKYIKTALRNQYMQIVIGIDICNKLIQNYQFLKEVYGKIKILQVTLITKLLLKKYLNSG